MGELVNLRRFRKTRDRAAAAEEASRRRAAYGRTAAEREASAADRERSDVALDRHRLDRPGDGSDG